MMNRLVTDSQTHWRIIFPSQRIMSSYLFFPLINIGVEVLDFSLTSIFPLIKPQSVASLSEKNWV